MSVKQKLSDYKKKTEFFPDFFSITFQAAYIIRLGLLNAIKANAHYIKGNVLDVGCGRKPYKSLFSFDKYIGIDVEQSGHSHVNEEIDKYYDGEHIPFEENVFDSVISTEVLEHVFKPDLYFSEVHRVLKPDGCFLFTVPFMWDEHEKPYDYGRYSSFGLKYLLNKNGFEIVEFQKTATGILAIGQILNSYVQKIISSLPIAVKMLLYLLVCFPISLFSILLSYILPKNEDFYLNNVVVCRKKQ